MAAAVTYTTFCGMLVHENRGGKELDYVPDTLGSLAGTLDDGQTFENRAEYWPYGEQVAASKNPSPWGFVGLVGYFVDAVRSLYVRARHYDPGRGQWISRDPLWPSEEAYAYAASQPITYRDPTGTEGCPANLELLCKLTCRKLMYPAWERWHWQCYVKRETSLNGFGMPMCVRYYDYKCDCLGLVPRPGFLNLYNICRASVVARCLVESGPPATDPGYWAGLGKCIADGLRDCDQYRLW